MKHLAKELKPNKLSDISPCSPFTGGADGSYPSFLEGKMNAKNKISSSILNRS
jgi:hypothetical protein